MTFTEADIDAAARAIYETTMDRRPPAPFQAPKGDWARLVHSNKREYVEKARAALEAVARHRAAAGGSSSPDRSLP